MRRAFLAEKGQSRLELAQAGARVEQVVSAAGADLAAERARVRAEAESVAQAAAASKSADASVLDSKFRAMQAELEARFAESRSQFQIEMLSQLAESRSHFQNETLSQVADARAQFRQKMAARPA